jgi:pimeloyl-ACP methyl ester carboxylesterase
MTNKIITFSGWGQPHDALECLAPAAQHIPYYKASSIEKVYEGLGGTRASCVIAWSLGAQIAIRAIEEGALLTDHLVLLAPPYQFVTHYALRAGMKREEFLTFQQEFDKDSDKVLRQFGLRIAKNDRDMKAIGQQLVGKFPASEHWGYWLEELGRFSCRSVDFSAFPRTTIIQGNRDAVVDVSQLGLFVPFLEDCRIEIIDNCAHAPHLHDLQRVKQYIAAPPLPKGEG